MPKQEPDKIVEQLLAAKQPVSKAELRSVVDAVLANGGAVVSSYDEDGPFCGTTVPHPHVGSLVGALSGKGYTVIVFPYGIPVIDNAFIQVGRGGGAL
jgi:hypothetical protein